jgi:4-hydroxybutyrate dehydrogenase/sulfolactaldehyde 3-reductase
MEERTMEQTIGFIGLGVMGRPMAKNIISKGNFSVKVFDLNTEAVKALTASGAEEKTSATELASECDVIITMVPSSQNVEAAILGPNGILEGLRPGTIVIDMSTIDPAVTRKVAKEVGVKGGRFLDAPVGRTSTHAEEGTLSIMVGGDEDLFEACRPILSCMGTDLIYCGPVGSGETMKIINNLLTGMIVAANAETLALGAKAGLRLDSMLEVLRSTQANNGHLNGSFPSKAFRGDFTPGFATRLAYKDMNLALSLAGQLNVPLSVAAASTQLFNMARSMGHDNDDYTSVIRVMEQFTGMEVRG